jgi:hypothetical protein
MSIDLERELKLAMDEFTADVQAPPDLLSRLRRPGASWRSGRRVVLSAAAVAVALAGVVLVVPRLIGAGSTVTAADAIAGWGPARGDLAHDQTVLDRIAAEWARPSGHNADAAGFDPVNGDRPLQVLWAGTTPDGPAAYAVQHTTDSAMPWTYGVFIPDAHGQLQLYYRMQLEPNAGDGTPWQPQPAGYSFGASRALDSFVVVPTDPQATVEISTRHVTDSSGRVTPQWQDVVSTDGAAVIAVPSGDSIWDSVIRIRDGNTVAWTGAVNLLPAKDGPARPANALGLWCNACNVVRGGYDLGTGEKPWTVWTDKYAPDWYPTYSSEWTLGGYFHGHDEVLATQLWLPGEPAHTVVGVSTEGGRFEQIVSDVVTDPAQRPLVAVHVAAAHGWLIGAGPDAVVTGWRLRPSSDWVAVAPNKAVLVPTDAGSIQLRLVVAGQERVVTR